MKTTALHRTIVALDNMSKESAVNFLNRGEFVGSELNYIKVGLELFCSEGPRLVDFLAEQHQKKIFFRP